MGVYDYQKELLRKTDTLESKDSEYYRSHYLLGTVLILFLLAIKPTPVY